MNELIEYIYNQLKDLNIPVLYEERPETFPCVSFHIYNEHGFIYGDGDSVLSSGKLQIDIFTTKTIEIRELRKTIIKNLKTSKLVRIFKTTPDELHFEKDVKLFHQVVVFNFYFDESEVS